MSKFNTNSTVTPDTTNLAGGIAYARKDTRADIISVVLNSMLNGNSYYQSEKDRIDSILDLMSKNDPEFLAKLAVYVRTTANLRSVSHILAVKLAETVKGSTFLKSALTKTIVRPDDLTEILSLWNSRNEGKNIPNALRRAMKKSLETKWTEYNLKKYANESSKVKLKDVVKLARPNPNVGKYSDPDVFKKVIEGTLPNIETAQTINAGSTGAERASNYLSLIMDGKLGYMALLKNLKNILEADSSHAAISVLQGALADEIAVRKSRVLPMRFTQALTALDEISMDSIDKNKLVNALEKGFTYSAKNINLVPEDGRVALLLDESGSMRGQPFEIGKSLMASMLAGLNPENTVGYLWADRCREVKLTSPFDFIRNTRTHGGGTDVWAPLNKLIQTKTVVDLVVIFTDMELYDTHNRWGGGIDRKKMESTFNQYKQISPKAKLIFWNLEGYSGGTPMQMKSDVMEIAGFSDKMLEVIPKLLEDKDALVKEIESVEL